METTDSLAMQRELSSLFDRLDRRLDNRSAQLQVLTSMMSDNRLKREQTVAGTPINKGWMSSRYGMRADPFDGDQRWHAGVDFAGKKGSEIVAVASGVVTWSGKRSGYGKMVEINHGDGYVTRYATTIKILSRLAASSKKASRSPSWVVPAAPLVPMCTLKCTKTAARSTLQAIFHKTNR